MRREFSVQQEIRFIRRVTDKLVAANPKCEEQTAIDLAIQIVDLYEIGDAHRDAVRELLHLKTPSGNERIHELVQSMEASFVYDAAMHVKELQRAVRRYWKPGRKGKRAPNK